MNPLLATFTTSGGEESLGCSTNMLQVENELENDDE